MATTTLRVPDELKARVAELAERSGKTPHAFMLDAIEESVRAAEARAGFVEQARDRLQGLLESGHGIEWRDMRAHLEQRVAGKKGRAPRARSWRK